MPPSLISRGDFEYCPLCYRLEKSGDGGML